MEKERLETFAKQLHADLETSITRKDALDVREAALKELERKVKSARSRTCHL